MLRHVFIALLLLGCRILPAQTAQPEYFPSDLMKDKEIRVVAMYETVIGNPAAQAGVGNRIRLSRNLKKETYFSKSGTKERTLYFEDDGKTLKDFMIYRYDARGKMTMKSYHHGDGKGGSGDTMNPVDDFHRDTEYDYDGRGRLVKSQVYNGTTGKRSMTDSTAYRYDGQGRMVTETRFVIDAGKTIRFYEYASGGRATVTASAGPVVMTREERLMDDENRLISLSLYAGEEEKPRYTEHYSYDPRGWLNEVDFEYNWAHFKRFESVISQKNKYDDHGKLIEIQLDYGNGKRELHFFDYTYYVGD